MADKDDSTRPVEGCTGGQQPLVMTTEMILAYQALRGPTSLDPDDSIRRAIDVIDAGKPDGEWW